MRAAVAGLLLMLMSGLALAQALPDPAEEARARALFHELRCLVCQNQSIADSEAPLAQDLRALVRERIAGGDSDAGVKEFLVARYGEFVLLRPTMRPATLLLWAAPVIFLAVGAMLAVRVMRRRRADGRSEPAPLSDAERARLDALARGAGSGSTPDAA